MLPSRVRLILHAVPVLILLGCLILLLNLSERCVAQTCPEPAARGLQPYPTEMVEIFQKAGTNRLGNDGPTLPQIWRGYPPAQATPVAPYVPCILLEAVGHTESSDWYQFDADYGENGDTIIASDCGYGIMQITSGMNGDGDFTPSRVAAEPAYNVGTGALLLIQKWNSLSKYIGSNDPAVVEDWYYAVWSYNSWGYVNNPNNPNFNASRPLFDGTQPRSWYPYQELVWGYAAHPPDYQGTPFWEAVQLTLPSRSLITNPPPQHIDRPLPSHTSCSVAYLPIIENFCEKPDTYEPNNSFSTAASISFQQWYFSYIWTENDNDWYKFYVSASSSNPKYINIWLQGIPSGNDYDLYLYNPRNQQVAYSNAAGSSDEYIHKQVTQSGWYRVRIYPFSGFSKCHSYRVWVNAKTK